MYTSLHYKPFKRTYLYHIYTFKKVFNVVNNVVPKTKWKARGFFAMLLLGATTACKVRDTAHNNLNFWNLFWRNSREHPWLIDSYYNFVTENKWYGPVAKTSNGALKIRSAGAIIGNTSTLHLEAKELHKEQDLDSLQACCDSTTLGEYFK